MKLFELLAKAKQDWKAMLNIDSDFRDQKKKDAQIKKLILEQPEGKTCIELKRRGGNVLIKCWVCSKETYVRIGTQCHQTGLCGTCIGNVKWD